MTQQHFCKPATKKINRVVYAVFVLASIYFMAVKNYSQAMIFLGTALIFDPFDTNIPFAKRAVYQRVWLFVHLLITLALLVVMTIIK